MLAVGEVLPGHDVAIDGAPQDVGVAIAIVVADVGDIPAKPDVAV
jgi:hypothetical protein